MQVRIAVVGAGTGEILQAAGVSPEYTPSKVRLGWLSISHVARWSTNIHPPEASIKAEICCLLMSRYDVTLSTCSYDDDN